MARGHVYRRRCADGKLGKWNAVIDVSPDKLQARRQLTRTFATEKEAHLWLAEMTTLPRHTNDSFKLLMSVHMNEWLDSMEFIRTSTRVTYRSHIHKYLDPAFGNMLVSEVTGDAIERFAKDLALQGLTRATIRRILSTLSGVMRAAVRSGHAVRNPVEEVVIRGEAAKHLPTWTTDECRYFLASLNNEILDVCFRLALVTGLRRGELLGLRWEDLDLCEGHLHVRRARVVAGNEVIEGPTKSASGMRTVYLDELTANSLEALKETSRLNVPFGAQATKFLFVHEYGTPWMPWWLSRQFEQRITKLGLSRIRFHDLRHASATLGLASGETLREISARLGHSDISVTAAVYTEVVPEIARASAARRAEFMSSTNLKLSKSLIHIA